jgi:hypothetical protein
MTRGGRGVRLSLNFPPDVEIHAGKSPTIGIGLFPVWSRFMGHFNLPLYVSFFLGITSIRYVQISY